LSDLLSQHCVALTDPSRLWRSLVDRRSQPPARKMH
jgi:hypothetical protein